MIRKDVLGLKVVELLKNMREFLFRKRIILYNDFTLRKDVIVI